MFFNSLKGNDVKKKKLAPLTPKAKAQEKPAPVEKDEFEFSEDLLAEIFDDPALLSTPSTSKASKQNSSVKKKKVAPPCPKNTVKQQQLVHEKEDECEFSEELLAQVFEDPALLSTPPTSKEANKQPSSSKVVKQDFVDLDDWVPDFKVPSEPKISKPSEVNDSSIFKASNVMTKSKDVQPRKAVPTFTEKKEMMFSSMESLPDSTIQLRFLKRHVPAAKLKDLSASSQLVPLTEALHFTGKNWFTPAVVTDFVEFKNGGSGSIDVSDLSSEPFNLRILLFRTAFTTHKNLPAGSIVCISNPTKGKPFNGKVAMCVNDPDQILVAGTSRDYGVCGGRTKTGGACRAVVNLSVCRFCIYHAMAEKKQQNMAKEMKVAANGVGLGNRGNSSPGLWNAKASQASTLVAAKKNVAQIRKDRERLNKLNSSSSSPSSSSAVTARTVLPSSLLPASSDDLPKLDLTKLRQAAAVSSSLYSSPSTSNPKRNHSNVDSPSSDEPSPKRPMSVTSTPIRPEPSSTSSTSKMSAAKKRALNFVRENGGIAKEKPKAVRSLEEPEEKKKPSGITDEYLALMREKPQDENLLRAAEAIERDKKFDRLKIVEEIGEKLAATHEVPVRAVRCLVCKKIYHSMPMQCVMNKHGCKVVMGTKRYFECNSCRNRTTTLEKLPVAECGKCGVWSWKKAGVAVNKVCSVAAQLSIRGMEETFVGSIVKDPNLSLLVPEQVTE